MKHFYNVFFNTLIANVTTSFLWFGLTFWVYLETRNVMATAIIGGSYMLLIAFLSRVFGFAQSIEVAAAPITAFMIGPLAQFMVIPFMRSGHSPPKPIAD